MKFSVIIPVYNGWEYLREGVDSVLGQTGADFEVLLVDDGSTDGESGALCDTLAREHPDCIRVLHKPNGGAGDARNAALPLAQATMCSFSTVTTAIRRRRSPCWPPHWTRRRPTCAISVCA